MDKLFTNININLVNLHAGLHRFSNSIFDVFSAVYLLSLGLSFPAVALAWASSCALRIFLRPLGLKFSEKVGLKKALLWGTAINSGLFIVLAQANGLGPWLYFYIFYLALCDITYWLPYHAYYAAAGDEEKRGRQIGWQMAFIHLLKIAAPFVGGLLVENFGFTSLYLMAAVVMLLSAGPIFFVRDLSPGPKLAWRQAFRSIDKRGLLLLGGDGLLYAHGFIWTIILFYLVGNYAVFGGLVTFELLFTALLYWLLGRLIDKGRGPLINLSGLLIIGLAILMRIFWVVEIWQIITVDFILAVGMVLYKSSSQAAFYNMSKRTANTLWFHFFAEAGWDAGVVVALGLGAALFVAGVPLRLIMALSLAGLVVINRVLQNFYMKSHFSVGVAAVNPE